MIQYERLLGNYLKTKNIFSKGSKKVFMTKNTRAGRKDQKMQSVNTTHIHIQKRIYASYIYMDVNIYNLSLQSGKSKQVDKLKQQLIFSLLTNNLPSVLSSLSIIIIHSFRNFDTLYFLTITITRLYFSCVSNLIHCITRNLDIPILIQM